MAPICARLCCNRATMSEGFSRVQSPPICRCCSRPKSNSSSISKPRRRTVSLCRRRCSPLPTRCWNSAAFLAALRSVAVGTKRIYRAVRYLSAFGGEFNESTQHLLILADEEVCEWRGMHGHGSRRNRRLSCGSAGRAVNVWRTSRERLGGGTRAASIGSWLAMEGLLQRHAGGLWERCGLRSAKRFREALPPVGRYDGSHRASNDRPQLSAERSGVTAAAAPTAPARLISAPAPRPFPPTLFPPPAPPPPPTPP